MVKLLSGENPQIPKGDGDAVVQQYLDATPAWKGVLVRKLDALIVKNVPNVRKAVRWNSPFYGLEGQGWFASFHCLNKVVRVTFLRGQQLDPLPPKDSKHPDVRYYDIPDGGLDEVQFVEWVKQAGALPGAPIF